MLKNGAGHPPRNVIISDAFLLNAILAVGERPLFHDPALLCLI